jgi:hypothetical protein
LERVFTEDGREPEGAFPTIEKLLVSGNMKLPSSNTKNNWNAKKSLKLIRQYDPGYETDDETEEYTTSRKRRLVALGQHLGLMPAQLNMAVLTMNFI